MEISFARPLNHLQSPASETGTPPCYSPCRRILLASKRCRGADKSAPRARISVRAGRVVLNFRAAVNALTADKQCYDADREILELVP